MELTFYCVVCRQPIPDEKADRNGVTCSEGCSKLRRAIKRDRKRRKGVCDTCGHRWGQKRVTDNLQPCSSQQTARVNQQSLCVDGHKSSGP